MHMARKFLLTDIQVKALKPGEKLYRVKDGDGLFVVTSPSGGKWFEFRYRYQGKDKTLNLGQYPETSLADAREKHQAARKQFKTGIDPAAAKQAAVQAETFAAIHRPRFRRSCARGGCAEAKGVLGW